MTSLFRARALLQTKGNGRYAQPIPLGGHQGALLFSCVVIAVCFVKV